MNATGPHLDDGAIVRLLDEQPLPGEHDGHLSTCATCHRRLATLNRESDGLTRLLRDARLAEPGPPADLWARVQAGANRSLAGDDADGGPRPQLGEGAVRGARHTRWPRHSLAAAAVLACLVIAGALTAEPVRDWISGALRSVTTLLGPDDTASSSVAVSFVPVADTLTISFDEVQQQGVAHVVLEDRSDAQAEIMTDDPNATLLVLADGFRVRNAAGLTWSYRFQLPRTLAQVRIVVAGRTVQIIAPAEGRTVVDVQLGDANR